MLGEEDGRTLINSLLGEQEMAGTANQVLGSSATARRTDNPFKKQGKGDDRAGVFRSALNLDFGDAAKRGYEHVAEAMAGRQRNNLAKDVGPMLIAKGPEADRVAQALIASQGKKSAVAASNPKIEGIVRELLIGGARNQGALSR